MRRTVPPSAEIEEQIDALLAVGVGENPREALSERAKLGARLIIQRAVEMSSTPGLAGRATSAGPRRRRDCAMGFARGGCRPRRASCRWRSRRSGRQPSRSSPNCSRAAPSLLRSEPLKAMVVGAFVRGLSMRDVESLCEQAGLGKLSKSTAARMCSELPRALCGVRAPRPLRRRAGGAVPGCHLPRRAPRRA